MTYDEIVQAVDRLSLEERQQLRDYIEKTTLRTNPARDLSPDEWIQRMKTVAHSIREGFTDDEWEQIEADMNAEYIEAVDDNLWRD